MSDSIQEEEITLAEHKYKVFHALDDDGRRTGKGWVEQEETIHTGDDNVIRKWRRTGATYQAFMAKMGVEKDKQLAQKEHDQAMALLTRVRQDRPDFDVDKELAHEADRDSAGADRDLSNLVELSRAANGDR